jgi:hypothetical protein
VPLVSLADGLSGQVLCVQSELESVQSRASALMRAPGTVDVSGVGYDVDRKAGAWAMAQSIQRERRFWLAASATLLLATAITFGLLTGHRLSTAASAGLIVLALLARPYATRYTDRHFLLLGGAVAEQRVGETLEELRNEGWIVMHDIEQAHEGNIDHLVSGPNGIYLVETKARGYQDDALRKARRQAAKLHDELGAWVTPVICIDKRNGRAFKHDRVWIVPRQHLLPWLRSQRNEPVQFERLARYADGV